MCARDGTTGIRFGPYDDALVPCIFTDRIDNRRPAPHEFHGIRATEE